MSRCPVCDGRMVKTEHGKKCMNPNCEGATIQKEKEVVRCRCGEAMVYTGENHLGQPTYVCQACRATTKL